MKIRVGKRLYLLTRSVSFRMDLDGQSTFLRPFCCSMKAMIEETPHTGSSTGPVVTSRYCFRAFGRLFPTRFRPHPPPWLSLFTSVSFERLGRSYLHDLPAKKLPRFLISEGRASPVPLRGTFPPLSWKGPLLAVARSPGHSYDQHVSLVLADRVPIL